MACWGYAFVAEGIPLPLVPFSKQIPARSVEETKPLIK